MKATRVFFGLMFSLSIMGSANASWFDGGSPYLGGGGSYSIYDNIDDVIVDNVSNAPGYQSKNIGKNALGFMGFGGWTFFGGYSLELSYADFGEFDATGRYANGSVDELTGKFTGKGIGMRYDWAETDSVNVYGRVGVMRWEATWDGRTRTNTGPWVEVTEGDTNGSEVYLGVGGQYRIVSNIYAYVEGFYLDARFDQDGFGSKQPVYAVIGGLMFRFGDVARSSGSTDKRTREVTACDPKYKDISGIMCE